MHVINVVRGCCYENLLTQKFPYYKLCYSNLRFWYVHIVDQFPCPQVETLRKQDSSLQLSRTREELSASLEKSGELESQLEDAKSRQDTLKSQLRQVEQKWKEVRAW